MDQGGDAGPVPVEHRRRPSFFLRKIHGLAVQVDVRVKVGQPVGERQARVPQRAGEGVADLPRRRVAAQLEHQVAHRGAPETLVEQAEQEGDRREADHDQRCALELLERRAVQVAVDEEGGNHDEADRERVDQEPERVPAKPARLPATVDENEGAGHARRADREQLDVLHVCRRARPGPQRDQVVRPERAERHLDELKPERSRIRHDHQHPLESRPQPPVREGQADVEEEGRRQDVEHRADRVERVDVGQLQCREAAREPARDHEGAEAAVGAPPPGDQTGQDERDGDPVEERDLHQVDVVGGGRDHGRADGKGTPHDRDCSEREQVGSKADVGSAERCDSGGSSQPGSDL